MRDRILKAVFFIVMVIYSLFISTCIFAARELGPTHPFLTIGLLSMAAVYVATIARGDLAHQIDTELKKKGL